MIRRIVRRRVLLGALGAGVLTLSIWGMAYAASPASALGMGHGRMAARSPLGRLIQGNIGRLITLKADMNVTEEQRSQLKGIVEKHREGLKDLAREAAPQKKALREAVLAEKPNEKEIRKAAEDLGKTLGDAAVMASKIVGEARPVLTPEQIELLKKFDTERDASVTRFLDEKP